MMNTIWGWFADIFAYLGWKYKSVSLLFLGLDNAGKTTLLQVLANGSLKCHPPTHFSTKEEIVIGNVKFSCFDLGGHGVVRRTWRNHFPVANGIVFIIDAADRERLSEARSELNRLLSADEIKDIPFLVLGNKIDIPKAISEDELRQTIGLIAVKTTGKNTSPKELELNKIRPIEVFMCSSVNRFGYGDALKWLAQFV